jgi:exodeoxyribonuclease VII small subunit
MSDERSTFETTRARLEDIVGQVRRKDVSLEQSLDMLEEAVRLVNQCNELIDQTSFKAPVVESPETGEADVAETADETLTVTEVVGLVDVDGDGVADTVVDAVIVAGEDWGAEDAWAGDSDVPGDEEDDARE